MDLINSFFSNIKDKLTNPFFGTLIIVLIVHHWEFWFTIFNFDADCTLEDRLIILKNYISHNITTRNFIIDVLCSLFYMFLGYMIVVGTRSLVIWIEHGLMPVITGKIVNKDVVLKSVYDQVVKEREEYFDQYEEQRKNVRIFSKQIDDQTQLIKEKDIDLLNQSSTISDKLKELNIANAKVISAESEVENQQNYLNELNKLNDVLILDNDLKEDNIKQFKSIFLDDDNNFFYDSLSKFPPRILKKIHEIYVEDKWMTFIDVANFIQNGGTLSGDSMKEMIKMELAYERGTKEGLTAIGEIIYNHRNVIKKYFERN